MRLPEIDRPFGIATVAMLCAVALSTERRSAATRPAPAMTWCSFTLIAGVVLAGILLGDVGRLLLPRTWVHFGWATLALVALAGAAIKAPRPGAAVLGYGLCAALPLYHVVYNTAGNVTYLPDTYPALLWAWVDSKWLQSAAESTR